MRKIWPILLLLIAASCKKNRFSESEFLTSMFELKVQPELNNTQSQIAQFASSWETYKSNKTEGNITSARNDFGAMLNAIEGIYFYNLGDIQYTYVYNRFNKTNIDTVEFWDFYGSQTQFLQSDISALANPRKGIYILEYLLFSNFSDDSLSSPKYVNLIDAVTLNLESDFSSLINSWGVYEKNFTEGLDEGVDGSYNMINNRIVHSLEDIIDKRLNPVIESLNSEQAIGNRSSNFLPNLKSQVLTLQAVYEGYGVSNFNSIHIALRKKKKKLATTVSESFEDIVTHQNTFDQNIEYYIQNDMIPIIEYKEKLKDLLVTFKLDVFNALGVILTFGDTDGD